MSTSVHKILIHGFRIIEWAPLPIGQLSEEAQEARNKDVKKYRENFSRKCARDKTMEDVYISSFGNHLKQQRKSFLPEAMTMFLCSDGSLMDDDDANDLNDI